MTKLPKEVENQIYESGDEFVKFVQKSAKLRAPRDTRELAYSINVTQRTKKQIVLNVGVPYGLYQEFGFRPHWIHTDMITGSNKFSQVYGGKRGFIFVRKFTPFFMPALERGLTVLPNLIQRHLNKAIKNSGGK